MNKEPKDIVIKEFPLEEMYPSCTWVVIGPPGSGKCCRFDEEVILFNGEIKKVQDVVIGDILMGDDSTPREVVQLFQGRDKIYGIHPQDGTNPYYVTGGHTLCLRYNTRPVLKREKGKYPRYRVTHTTQELDENNCFKVRETSTNYSVGKYTETGAKKLAEETQRELIQIFDENYFLHEVEVEEYLKQSKSFNHRLVGYRTGVEFSVHNVQPIDSYLVGVWLGDGASATTKITNIDQELIEYLYQEAEKMNMKITQGKDSAQCKGSYNYSFVSKETEKRGEGCNMFLNFLKEYNLLNNKHIPYDYLVNSRENRLKLLAGLIDTDGHYANKSYYEIMQKNQRLSNDIAFLARSLGFWCNITQRNKGCMYKGQYRQGLYYKITFGGNNLHELPVLLPRKKAEERLIGFQKEPLHYKIKITEEGEDDYYGFELAGTNNRFLLGDFTVTHNCLGKGTPVMMHDKTIRSVETIKTGEFLMGDDNIPRKVLSVCTGQDEMCKITQTNGITYTANLPHILVLIDKNGNKLEKEIQNILKQPQILESYKGYKIETDNFSTVSISDLQIQTVGQDNYYGFQIDGNGRFLLGDGTVTHNTTFMENVAYYHKNRYPVARIMIGTEGGYKRFCSIFQPLFVTNYYDETHEKSHILRQRTCVLDKSMEKSAGRFAINILDDVSDDTKIYKSKTMNALFKLGAQHYNQCFMIGSQYAIDLPPAIRKAVSYVALFREPEENERKKLYKNFGGICGSYDNFCDLMDQITGDYTCMIIVKRTQSNKIEDCVFWFRTIQLGDWKFGCKEYKEWATTRYNPNYVEKITV